MLFELCDAEVTNGLEVDMVLCGSNRFSLRHLEVDLTNGVGFRLATNGPKPIKDPNSKAKTKPKIAPFAVHRRELMPRVNKASIGPPETMKLVNHFDFRATEKKRFPTYLPGRTEPDKSPRVD